jgi:phage tail protein X
MEEGFSNASDQTDLQKAQEPLKTIIVKEGDTFTGLALKVYGRVEEGVLDFVRKHNPELEDVNSLAVGQKLVFPPLPVSTPAAVFTVRVASFEAFDQAFNMSRKLRGQGYEAFIMPVLEGKKGESFSVAVGNFESRPEAGSYAKMMLQRGVSDDAEVMQLEMK